MQQRRSKMDNAAKSFMCPFAGCDKRFFHKRQLRRHQRDKNHLGHDDDQLLTETVQPPEIGSMATEILAMGTGRETMETFGDNGNLDHVPAESELSMADQDFMNSQAQLSSSSHPRPESSTSNKEDMHGKAGEPITEASVYSLYFNPADSEPH